MSPTASLCKASSLTFDSVCCRYLFDMWFSWCMELGSDLRRPISWMMSVHFADQWQCWQNSISPNINEILSVFSSFLVRYDNISRPQNFLKSSTLRLYIVTLMSFVIYGPTAAWGSFSTLSSVCDLWKVDFTRSDFFPRPQEIWVITEWFHGTSELVQTVHILSPCARSVIVNMLHIQQRCHVNISLTC